MKTFGTRFYRMKYILRRKIFSDILENNLKIMLTDSCKLYLVESY